MTAYRSRQMLMLCIVALALLLGVAGSQILRGILLPITIGPPLYINPIYILAALLYIGFGFLVTSGSADGGWPWYLALIGLWAFIISFEDSILQWFVIQFGAAFSGGRVNPFQITMIVVAFAAAIMLHANQMGRRLHEGLQDRGLDPRELRDIERQSFQAAAGVVTQLVVILAVGAVVLRIGEVALGRASVGLGPLGILGGILIVGVIAMLAYSLLRQGPVPGVVIEPGSETGDPQGISREAELRDEARGDNRSPTRARDPRHPGHR